MLSPLGGFHSIPTNSMVHWGTAICVLMSGSVPSWGRRLAHAHQRPFHSALAQMARSML